MRPSSSAAREPVPLRLPPARLRPLGAAIGRAQDRRAHVRHAQEAAEQVSLCLHTMKILDYQVQGGDGGQLPGLGRLSFGSGSGFDLPTQITH